MTLLNNFLALGYGAILAKALALAAKVGISTVTIDSVIRRGLYGNPPPQVRGGIGGISWQDGRGGSE